MRFPKGVSGNPAGRPRGARSQAKLREAIARDVPEIIAAMVASAKDGDTAAAKVLLDRVLPSLRPTDQPTSFRVQDSLSATGRSILEEVGAGKVTPQQGATLLQSLGSLVRVMEVDDLAARIEALEKRMGSDR
jgi:hypothetical protein